MSREVMQQALEALEHTESRFHRVAWLRKQDAITALRLELEKPADEPVATKISARGSFLHPAWDKLPIGASLYARPLKEKN